MRIWGSFGALRDAVHGLHPAAQDQPGTRRADGGSGLQLRAELLCSNPIFDTLPAFIRWFHSRFGTADVRGRPGEHSNSKSS